MVFTIEKGGKGRKEGREMVAVVRSEEIKIKEGRREEEKVGLSTRTGIKPGYTAVRHLENSSGKGECH